MGGIIQVKAVSCNFIKAERRHFWTTENFSWLIWNDWPWRACKSLGSVMYKPLSPRPQERHHHPPFSIEAQFRLLRSLSLSPVKNKKKVINAGKQTQRERSAFAVVLSDQTKADKSKLLVSKCICSADYFRNHANGLLDESASTNSNIDVWWS